MQADNPVAEGDPDSGTRPPWWRAPLSRLAQWREERALARRAIPEDLWQLTLTRLPFLARLDEAWQEERWGVDEEAADRNLLLRVEAEMLDRWFRALSTE